MVQVMPLLCNSVARWQEVVPVAVALRNPAMQERHWTKLQLELGISLPIGPAFTLHTLFALKVCPSQGSVPAPSPCLLPGVALPGALHPQQVHRLHLLARLLAKALLGIITCSCLTPHTHFTLRFASGVTQQAAQSAHFLLSTGGRDHNLITLCHAWLCRQPRA